MRKSQTNARQLVMAALCAALGVVLPVALHSIPNAGSILLPMHIPVLLCGLVCGPVYGLGCGVLTPLLSSLITGMPPAAVLPYAVRACRLRPCRRAADKNRPYKQTRAEFVCTAARRNAAWARCLRRNERTGVLCRKLLLLRVCHSRFCYGASGDRHPACAAARRVSFRRPPRQSSDAPKAYGAASQGPAAKPPLGKEPPSQAALSIYGSKNFSFSVTPNSRAMARSSSSRIV